MYMNFQKMTFDQAAFYSPRICLNGGRKHLVSAAETAKGRPSNMQNRDTNFSRLARISQPSSKYSPPSSRSLLILVRAASARFKGSAHAEPDPSTSFCWQLEHR